jgi:hypothetical protein
MKGREQHELDRSIRTLVVIFNFLLRDYIPESTVLEANWVLRWADDMTPKDRVIYIKNLCEICLKGGQTIADAFTAVIEGTASDSQYWIFDACSGGLMD